MSVRLANIQDIAAMHTVRMAVRENVLSDPSKVTPLHYREYLTGRGRGWVYEIEQRIVGFAIGDAAQRSVWALFVHPDHERRGIGRQLHDAMVAWLFKLDSRKIWLTSGPGTRAAGFYEAAGWQRAGIEPNGDHRYELEYRA